MREGQQGHHGGGQRHRPHPETESDIRVFNVFYEGQGILGNRKKTPRISFKS